jgi:hypothetical protein
VPSNQTPNPLNIGSTAAPGALIIHVGDAVTAKSFAVQNSAAVGSESLTVATPIPISSTGLTLSANPTVTPGNTGTLTLTPAVTAGKAKNAGIFNGTLSLISTPSNTQVGTETVTYQVNNFAAQTANYTGVGSFNGGGGATQSLT